MLVARRGGSEGRERERERRGETESNAYVIDNDTLGNER